MSNYYDLETDLGVEDVEAEGGYEEAEDYEEYENYDVGSDFGNYNPEEADARWGEKDFDELVVEMESIVSRGKRYFFSKKKRVVNGEELAQLAQHIQNKLPSEIIAAKDIITRQVEIIDDANSQKASILAGAHKEETETVTELRNITQIRLRRVRMMLQLLLHVQLSRQMQWFRRATSSSLLRKRKQEFSRKPSSAFTSLLKRQRESAKSFALRQRLTLSA